MAVLSKPSRESQQATTPYPPVRTNTDVFRIQPAPPYDLDDTGPVILADWIGRGITYNTLDSIPARLHCTIDGNFAISEELESYFFPFPHLPLNHIVDWTIPPFNIKTNIPPSSFFSPDQPNEQINTSNVQHIQVPARQVLAKLFKASRQAWLDGAKSVVLAYHINDGTRYPLSLVGFWLRLYDLMRDTIDPWTKAVDWVKRQRFPTAIQDDIEELFATVQWSGYLRSFTESPPLASLAKILSDEWLDDTHITHLLDLLDHVVLNHPESGSDLPPFITVPPLITHDILHRHSLDRQISPRVADLEEFIHTGDVMQFTFITHVNGNHWTALNVNLETAEMVYGDSMGGVIPGNLRHGLQSWISEHGGPDLHLSQMKIPIQHDTFNCGPFAWAALLHHHFPVDHKLPTHYDGALIRATAFIRILNAHQEAFLPRHTSPNVSTLDLQSSDPDDHPSPPASSPEPSSPIASGCLSSPLSHNSPGTQPPESLKAESWFSSKAAPAFKPRSPTPSISFIGISYSKCPKVSVFVPASRKILPAKQVDLASFFKVLTAEEARVLDRNRQTSHMARIRREEYKEMIEEREMKRQLDEVLVQHRQRETWAEKKRRQRKRKLDAEIESGKRLPNGKKLKHEKNLTSLPLLPSSPSSSPLPELSVAEMTRPKRQFKREHQLQNPKRQTQPLGIAERTHWKAPWSWKLINEVAERHLWASPHAIVHELQTRYPSIFGMLSPQVLGRWIEVKPDGTRRWKDSVQLQVKQGYQPGGQSTRTGILASRPDLLDGIKDHLSSLRRSGLSITTVSARSFIIAYLLEKNPGIFEIPWKNGRMFEVSEAWVRRFFGTEMHWSERRATRAAQKVPANWVEQMQELRLRLAWYIKEYDIPPELIINFDQTNIVYSHGSSTTWAPTGSKQVAVVGLEEKRAFTVVVGVTCAGQAVPFQVIYKGATTASVPSPAANSYPDCLDLSFQFLPSGTETYWASFETMVMYLRDIIEPFVSQAKEKLGLPNEQKTILLMDAWAVHHSRQFLDHLASHYPNFLPAFVPAGCTGYSQPCDLLPQRILKHIVRQVALEDAIAEVRQQIASGATPEDVKLDTGIKTLRNRSPRWLLKGFNGINKPEVAAKAFGLCQVGDTGFDYSYESLSSRETRQELWSLSKTHPELYAHLASHHSSSADSAAASFVQPVFLNELQSLEPTLIEEEIDTDVSQAAAIAFISERASSAETLTRHGVHAVGGRLESNDNIPVCDSSECPEEIMSGALSVVALEQEVVLVEGEAVGTEMETAETEELGRGKRHRRPNPHYSYSFYEAH